MNNVTTMNLHSFSRYYTKH